MKPKKAIHVKNTPQQNSKNQKQLVLEIENQKTKNDLELMIRTAHPNYSKPKETL